MASDRARPEPAASFAERLPRSRLALLLLPLVLIAGVMLVRTGGLRSTPSFGLTAGVEGATAAALTDMAADVITTALAKGGAGLEFEIIQTSTITARPSGPLVDIPDPADRTKSLGTAEHYALGTLIGRGTATPDGFWMEIVTGPMPGEESTFDVAKAAVRRSALVRGGTQFRNDGDGWHPTEALPGIGLDPATVALLPTMLTDASDVSDIDLDAFAPSPNPSMPTDALSAATIELDTAAIAATIDGLSGSRAPPARALEATTKVADVPGIIATDLAEATEITTPARLGFDDAGRLVSLTIVARNTLLDVHDLIIETFITFRYPDAPPELPKPEPAYVAPAPASDGE